MFTFAFGDHRLAHGDRHFKFFLSLLHKQDKACNIHITATGHSLQPSTSPLSNKKEQAQSQLHKSSKGVTYQSLPQHYDNIVNPCFTISRIPHSHPFVPTNRTSSVTQHPLLQQLDKHAPGLRIHSEKE